MYVAKTKALISYRAADLGLCFCMSKKQVFSSCGSYYTGEKTTNIF